MINSHLIVFRNLHHCIPLLNPTFSSPVDILGCSQSIFGTEEQFLPNNLIKIVYEINQEHTNYYIELSSFSCFRSHLTEVLFFRWYALAWTFPYRPTIETNIVLHGTFLGCYQQVTVPTLKIIWRVEGKIPTMLAIYFNYWFDSCQW